MPVFAQTPAELKPQNLFMKYLLILSAFIGMLAQTATAQQETFTRADTLRGTITPERAWWDVSYYDLHVTVQPEDSSIQGFNTITYTVTEPSNEEMQIDLQEPLQIDRIIQEGNNLSYRREGNAFFVAIPNQQKVGSSHTISIYYRGKPRVAVNAPWDGGFVWSRDSLGNPWIATANQGLGASVWWPNKDHQIAEPDSMSIHITVPDSLVNVSNGRLRNVVEHNNNITTYSWHVSNPINNYNVAVNAGNYVNFKDSFHGEKGTLDLSYWVLEHHLEEAKKQFEQTKPMLRCFERWFGPYPFYEDSFKLVETPHLGMEHQSAVAYGNEFQNGYMGRDLSGTGWGLKWDFILVHESAHEWWGNNITTKDIADMWVHEGFTSYSEVIYTECRFGEQAANEYAIGLRKNIQNDRPIIGKYGVNHEGSGDMYYKGNNMLHTIRQIIDDTEQWRQILRGLQDTFYHTTTTSEAVESYISKQSGTDLSKVFDQYLRTTNIPVFQYYIENDQLHYRWRADVENFDMPIKVTLSEDAYTFIYPTSDKWKSIELGLNSPSAFEVDPNFYVDTQQLSEKPGTN